MTNVVAACGVVTGGISGEPPDLSADDNPVVTVSAIHNAKVTASAIHCMGVSLWKKELVYGLTGGLV